MTVPRILILAAIFSVLPSVSEAALLYLDPSEETHGLGDTFIANVRLDNQDECINAVKVEVDYPTDRLKAIDFGRGASILSLWVEEPKINTERGMVTFSGGIPGGYCGRIRGDPALSNILGKIVFTVINAEQDSADVTVGVASRVYLNDGQGTRADLKESGAKFTLVRSPLAPENPWLKEIDADKTPPDPFTIEVQSTEGVFGGRYYVVFATQDKQSGMEQFEILEKGVWRPIMSPYSLHDQSLENIQIKAIDKAGNERLGDYVAGLAPERVRPLYFDYVPFAVVIIIFLVLVGATVYMNRRKVSGGTLPTQP